MFCGFSSKFSAILFDHLLIVLVKYPVRIESVDLIVEILCRIVVLRLFERVCRMFSFVFEGDHNENVIHVHRDSEDQFLSHRVELLSVVDIDVRDVVDDDGFGWIRERREVFHGRISRRGFGVDNRIFRVILRVYDGIQYAVHRFRIHDDLIIVDDVFLRDGTDDEIHDRLLS